MSSAAACVESLCTVACCQHAVLGGGSAPLAMRHAEPFAALYEAANTANSIHKVKAVGLAGPWAGCACRLAWGVVGGRAMDGWDSARMEEGTAEKVLATDRSCLHAPSCRCGAGRLYNSAQEAEGASAHRARGPAASECRRTHRAAAT